MSIKVFYFFALLHVNTGPFILKLMSSIDDLPWSSINQHVDHMVGDKPFFPRNLTFTGSEMKVAALMWVEWHNRRRDR